MFRSSRRRFLNFVLTRSHTYVSVRPRQDKYKNRPWPLRVAGLLVLPALPPRVSGRRANGCRRRRGNNCAPQIPLAPRGPLVTITQRFIRRVWRVFHFNRRNQFVLIL